MRIIDLMTTRARPFLKWAGGKARSADELASLAPRYPGRYREPFMGSAALFFALRPEQGTLSDANDELVTCFQEVKRDPDAVMTALDAMVNTRAEFERIRRLDPAELDQIARAARVIYLNKTSFRGLWRVNRRGMFNTPYGEYQRPYYNRETLLHASQALQAAEVSRLDFGDAISAADPGDFVYLDPPYVPETQWGDFRRYTAGQFDDRDHRRLAELMRVATSRGVFLMMTNSDMPQVQEIYDGFHFSSIATRRDIHLTSALRHSTDLIIRNYVLLGDAPAEVRRPAELLPLTV